MKQTVSTQAGEGLETSEEGEDLLTLVDKGVRDLHLLRLMGEHCIATGNTVKAIFEKIQPISWTPSRTY